MNVTRRAREDFVKTLPSSVQLVVNQDFGKPDLRRCFYLEPSFFHVLLPIYRSSFLSHDDQRSLSNTCAETRTLVDLFHDYNTVDFRPLRTDRSHDWDQETELNLDWLRMTTAALLHYQGDLSSVVRFIGGTHVGANRGDHAARLASLDGIVDSPTLSHLRRIWTQGVPNYVNATSLQTNFRAYVNYGNHMSVKRNPSQSLAAALKDNRSVSTCFWTLASSLSFLMPMSHRRVSW